MEQFLSGSESRQTVGRDVMLEDLHGINRMEALLGITKFLDLRGVNRLQVLLGVRKLM